MSSAPSTQGLTSTSCTRSPRKLPASPGDGSKATPRARQHPPAPAASQRRAAASLYAAPSTTWRARPRMVTDADRLTTVQPAREPN